MQYIQFIVFTAGTLLAFFWMVVILGHRRQRNFERILFFLCLALFFFYGASLLEFNSEAFYSAAPEKLTRFAWFFLGLGLTLIPALLVHLQIEYAAIRGLLDGKEAKWAWLAAAYVPLGYFLPHLWRVVEAGSGSFDFITPVNALGTTYKVWLAAALTAAAAWQWWFAKTAPDQQQKGFHRSLVYDLPIAVIGVLALHVARDFGANIHLGVSLFLAALPLVPLGALVRNVQRFNFLQIGRQRNLIYAVFVTFLALLYLSLVRRVSLWLEASVPPESTAAILLFLPVVFFEPLQRLLRTSLRRTAVSEIDRVQRMMGPIQEMARLGDLSKLKAFCETWISEQLQLASVEIVLEEGEEVREPLTARAQESQERFTIQNGGRFIGELRVSAHGAMISGETLAALEYISEQLPGPLDLCRLIEEKLRLERDLAERERLAVLGQMAASISHNLKNPLGSIKTILQVQMENAELPETVRGETRMVLQEIERLSAKLNQLLRFSRPVIRGSAVEASCDPRAVVEEVVGVLRHEAERRGVRLGSQILEGRSNLDASAEALHDVISNLVVNALEASSAGGEVNVGVCWTGRTCVLSVEDDGAGIPLQLQEKVLQPFFTTKPQGTGLGLAIVARRVAEFGGRMKLMSPAKQGKGTRFEVTLSPTSFPGGENQEVSA